MSCPDGVNCLEPMKRSRALIMLGLTMVVFILLSAFSFVSSRNQITPDKVSFGHFKADDGKKVFQAYNCMGCHTLVGNGAYFAPDLTKQYSRTGPAWLIAFLGSAAHWPTEAVVRAQLMNEEVALDSGVKTIEEYYKKYPGALERIQRRGGGSTYMPNLAFRDSEIGSLVAYLKYTSAMNTEGWPPEVMVGDLRAEIIQMQGSPNSNALLKLDPINSGSANKASEVSASTNSVEHGKQLAKNYGCVACHSEGENKTVGPGWGNLYGSQVALSNGATVVADEAFIVESILQPNATLVAGYPANTMPSYEKILKDDEVKSIVDFIKSLGKK